MIFMDARKGEAASREAARTNRAAIFINQSRPQCRQRCEWFHSRAGHQRLSVGELRIHQRAYAARLRIHDDDCAFALAERVACSLLQCGIDRCFMELWRFIWPVKYSPTILWERRVEQQKCYACAGQNERVLA